MANLLYRLGRFSYQRRKLVAAIWTFVLVLLGVGALTLGGQTSNTFSIPGTESQRALDALAEGPAGRERRLVHGGREGTRGQDADGPGR